jgi:hypothetical protein
MRQDSYKISNTCLSSITALRFEKLFGQTQTPDLKLFFAEWIFRFRFLFNHRQYAHYQKVTIVLKNNVPTA